jgi:hypothetical protein
MKSLTLAITFLALIGITICRFNSKDSNIDECDNLLRNYFDDLMFYFFTQDDVYLERQHHYLESVKNICQSDLSQVCINDLENMYDKELLFDNYIKKGDFDAADQVMLEVDDIIDKIGEDCYFITPDLTIQKQFVLAIKDLSVNSLKKAIAAKQQ